MENEQELWDEYDRAMERDDFETARAILDRIPPVSDEAWYQKLNQAPVDDEPVSPELQKRLDEFEVTLARTRSRHTG